MAVTSTKGLKIWLEKGGTSRTDITPTAIATGKNPEVTFDNTGGKVSVGDLVFIKGTAFVPADGYTFNNTMFVLGAPSGADTIAATASATASLLGANIASGTLGSGSPLMQHVESSNLVSLCLSTMDISSGSPNTIDISTFCQPGASLPGNPTPGSFTFAGYTDITDAGYLELLDAERDGKSRALKIDIPNQGYLVADTIIGSVAWNLPLEGSSDYSFQASQGTPLRHLF